MDSLFDFDRHRLEHLQSLVRDDLDILGTSGSRPYGERAVCTGHNVVTSGLRLPASVGCHLSLGRPFGRHAAESKTAPSP